MRRALRPDTHGPVDARRVALQSVLPHSVKRSFTKAAPQAADKVCTGLESNTSGAKALIAEVRYGPAEAVP